MQNLSLAWLALAAVFLIAVAVREFRRKAYLWAACSGVLALTSLLVPWPTTAVAIDLPAEQK